MKFFIMHSCSITYIFMLFLDIQEKFCLRELVKFRNMSTSATTPRDFHVCLKEK